MIAKKYLSILFTFLLLVSCQSNKLTAKKDPIYFPGKALLILDIQKDFVADNAAFPVDLKQLPALLQNINQLTTWAQKNKVDVIYIQTTFAKSSWILNYFRNYAAIDGNVGTEFDPRMNMVSSNIFTKDSGNAFANPKLNLYLKQHKIGHLYISGVFADQCVLASAKGARALNFEVSVVIDAIAAKSDEDVDDAISKYIDLGFETVTTERLTK